MKILTGGHNHIISMLTFALLMTTIQKCNSFHAPIALSSSSLPSSSSSSSSYCYYSSSDFFRSSLMNLGSSSSSNTRYNSNSNSNNNNNNNRRSQLRISMQDDVVDERKEIVDSNKQMDVNEGSSVAATATATTVATATTTTTNANIHSKLRTLKDRMWVREALEDLTAAEFACSLAAPSSNTATTISNNEKKKKSTLDYENILSKLENRIDDMCVINQATDDENTNTNNNNCIYVSYPENYGDNICDDNDETKNGQNTCYSLKKNSGMGRVTYTDEQRISLLT